jgi:hypothetical protein
MGEFQRGPSVSAQVCTRQDEQSAHALSGTREALWMVMLSDFSWLSSGAMLFEEIFMSGLADGA